MSYCVNCGGELDDTAERCPLCFTPVRNPNMPVDSESPKPFPTRNVAPEPVSQKELALLVTAMLASVALCCALLNLIFHSERMWSLYAVGAAVMLWVFFVPPLLVRPMPGWGKLTLDVLAIGVYVYLISIDLGGQAWFWPLAMPIILSAAALTGLLSWLLRGRRRSLLTSVVLSLCTIALFALSIEFFADRFAGGPWRPGWSLVVLTVCVALCIPLIVVRNMPNLREEARRRFHL